MSGYTAVERSQSNLCDMRSGLRIETLTAVLVNFLVIRYSSRGTLRTRRSRSTTFRRVTIAGPGALKSCSARVKGAVLTLSIDLSSAACSNPVTDRPKLS